MIGVSWLAKWLLASEELKMFTQFNRFSLQDSCILCAAGFQYSPFHWTPATLTLGSSVKMATNSYPGRSS
jgi:hypothetical protein